MIYTRDEFIKQIDEDFRMQRVGDTTARDDSPVWQAESRYRPGERIRCQWFVCTKPLKVFEQSTISDFYAWCADALQGYAIPFMTDDIREEEWWGFTVEEDITAWMLRWVK